MLKDLQADVLAAPGAGRGTRRTRPFGILAITFLLTLQALGLALLLLLFAAIASGVLPLPASAGRESLPPYLALIELIPTAGAAIGLWRGRRWAWYLTMLLLAATMSFDIWDYLHGRPSYLSMLLNVLMVFYLNQQEVRSLFVPPTPARQALAAAASEWALAAAQSMPYMAPVPDAPGPQERTP